MSNDSSARSALGVYGISVASELTGLGPQTLRLYETRGLLSPARSDGGTRRYSEDDLTRLRRITELVTAGINLAGVAQIVELEARNARLESANARLTSDKAQWESDHPTTARGRRAGRRKDGDAVDGPTEG